MARIDISDSLGVALNVASRKYKATLNQKVRDDFSTRGKLTVVEADRIYVPGRAVAGDTFQAYQPAFTPNNQIDIHGREIKLQDVKWDLEITPANIDHLLDKWAPELRQFGDDLMVNAFVKKLYDEVLMPQYMEDLEYKAVWSGVRVAPTAGTAGATTAAVDGFAKIIADAITATTLTPIATGAFAANTVYDKVLGFTRSLPQVYRGVPGEIYCSRGLFELFVDACLLKNQYVVNTMTAGATSEIMIPTTNKKLVVLNSMFGSNRLVFDGSRNKDNMVMLVQKGKDILPTLKWESYRRVLSAWSDWSMAFGVEDFTTLFVNDQV